MRTAAPPFAPTALLRWLAPTPVWKVGEEYGRRWRQWGRRRRRRTTTATAAAAAIAASSAAVATAGSMSSLRQRSVHLGRSEIADNPLQPIQSLRPIRRAGPTGSSPFRLRRRPSVCCLS